MKSIPALLSEARSKKLAEGFTEEQINAAVKDCLSPEHRLSVVSKLTKGKVTESKRIDRKNGSGSVDISESDAARTRIASYAKKLKVSEAQAALHLGLPYTEKADTNVPELREAWRRYCPALRPEELDALVAREVPVPQR